MSHSQFITDNQHVLIKTSSENNLMMANTTVGIPVAVPVDSNASNFNMGSSPTPMAPPAYTPSTPVSEFGSLNAAAAREFLTSQEWPPGLQTGFLRNISKIPMRFFILDDSGSMVTGDGHRVLGEGNKKKLVGCTRWSELGDAMRFHATLAHVSNAVSQFRTLNASLPITVGGNDDGGHSYRRVMELFDNSPSGGTPLCRHIREVVEEIRCMEPFLRTTGQKVAVIIATDGESTDGDIVNAMRPLHLLPVWVVIRLCTDEDRICNYWNNIDKILELDLDILDDLQGEAKEVTTANSWLTYGEPLHRMREFGVTIKEFDLIDEDKLNGDQIMVFLSLIFGCHINDFPHPEVNWSAFCTAVHTYNLRAAPVWDVLRGRPMRWVREEKLGYYFKRRGGACAVS